MSTSSSRYFLRPRGQNGRAETGRPLRRAHDYENDDDGVSVCANVVPPTKTTTSAAATATAPKRKTPSTGSTATTSRKKQRQAAATGRPRAAAAAPVASSTRNTPVQSPHRRVGNRNNDISQSSTDDGDESMDEVLADLRPLKQTPAANRDHQGGTSGSASGIIAAASTAASMPAATNSTNDGSEEDFVILDNDSSPETGAAAASRRRNARPVPSPVRLLGRRRVTARMSTAGQSPRPRPRAPTTSGSSRTRRWRAAGWNSVVITLGDSDQEDDNGQRGEQRNTNNSAAGDNAPTSDDQTVTNDEEYARRLQQELDREYVREERMRRLQRIQRIQRLVAMAHAEREEASSTGAQRTNPEGGTRADVRDAATSTWVTSRDAATATTIPGSTTTQQNRPTFTAFHRRPVPERENTSSTATGTDTAAGRQVMRSHRLASTVRVNVGAANAESQTQADRDRHGLFALVDFPRIRRVLFERAARLGDFEQLESALLELALALGAGLTNEQIDRLPVSVYSSSTGSCSTSNTTCTICMEEFVNRDVQRHMPCSHTFHKACIDVWLKEKSTCPICRVDARGDSAAAGNHGATHSV